MPNHALSTSPAARRMRRYRQRQRDGSVFVQGDVPANVIYALMDAGYLAEWDASNPEAVFEALLEAAGG